MKRKNSLQLTNNSPIAISPGKAQKRREEEIQVITLLEIERMFRIAILEKIAVRSSGEKKITVEENKISNSSVNTKLW